MKLSRSKLPLFNPRLGCQNPALRLVALCLISVSVCCQGQGTFNWITFDGPPPQPSGTAFLIQRYDEAGMSFVPLPGSVGFVRSGGGRDGFADNGSPYLQTGLGTSLMFSFTNGTVFDMISVDLAEFSVTVTNTTVRFVGYRYDGSVVTTDLTTDGIIDGTGPLPDFETFYFGSEFSGLERVEIPTYGWSLDNLVVSVPEPAGGTLLVAGGLLLGALRGFRGRRACRCMSKS